MRPGDEVDDTLGRFRQWTWDRRWVWGRGGTLGKRVGGRGEPGHQVSWGGQGDRCLGNCSPHLVLGGGGGGLGRAVLREETVEERGGFGRGRRGTGSG